MDNLRFPNGLTFSHDKKHIYVNLLTDAKVRSRSSASRTGSSLVTFPRRIQLDRSETAVFGSPLNPGIPRARYPPVSLITPQYTPYHPEFTAFLHPGRVGIYKRSLICERPHEILHKSRTTEHRGFAQKRRSVYELTQPSLTEV